MMIQTNPILARGIQKMRTYFTSLVKKVLIRLDLHVSRESVFQNRLSHELSEALLGHCQKVLHIGAHFGEEAEVYRKFGVRVLWIEADPETYKTLLENQLISGDQTLNILLGDDEGALKDFHVYSNQGASSSIFELSETSGFKGINKVEVKQLVMRRMDCIFSEFDLKEYDFWVIDAQGAELEIIKGAGTLLAIPTFIKVEVSTYSVYTGQKLHFELESYLMKHGFVPLIRPKRIFHGDLIFVRVKT